MKPDRILHDKAAIIAQLIAQRVAEEDSPLPARLSPLSTKPVPNQQHATAAGRIIYLSTRSREVSLGLRSSVAFKGIPPLQFPHGKKQSSFPACKLGASCSPSLNEGTSL